MQDLGTITPASKNSAPAQPVPASFPYTSKSSPTHSPPIGIYRSLVLPKRPGEPVDAPYGTFLLESAKISAEGESAAWDRYSFIGASSRSTLTTVDGAVHWQGRTPAGAPVDGDPVKPSQRPCRCSIPNPTRLCRRSPPAWSATSAGTSYATGSTCPSRPPTT